MSTHNQKSSFTGYGCAYSRIFSGIFPSVQIYNSLLQNGNPAEMKTLCAGMGIYVEFAPYFEARYRMTEKVISESGIMQTVEIASGLSPHFYDRTRDPANVFVEIDLPENMEVKRRVVIDLLRDGVIPPLANHLTISGNAINPVIFQMAVSHLHMGPVVFVLNGLLRYVSPGDREFLFRQLICPVLLERKGLIVTHDIELLSDANATPESVARYDRMVDLGGFDVRPNLFKDHGDARQFFGGLGGTLIERSLLDVRDQLISPIPLGMTYPKVSELLKKHPHCFVVSFV